ncbi:Uncharacterised protein [Mycobacteroides abscessus subsp. abscessus]|nr:Uncharacterised protein [Mycobacteroides abscessus subsp. abscessus]
MSMTQLCTCVAAFTASSTRFSGDSRPHQISRRGSSSEGLSSAASRAMSTSSSSTPLETTDTGRRRPRSVSACAKCVVGVIS